MGSACRGAVAWLLAGLLASSCATKVPPAKVAWNPSATVIAPKAPPSEDTTGVGYLRVYTDCDLHIQGSLSYDQLRRSYDLYDPEGKLLRADVPNRGQREGADPVSVPLSPGRYVVASVWGTTYRKVQVEILPGETTEVSSETLSEAPAVFR